MRRLGVKKLARDSNALLARSGETFRQFVQSQLPPVKRTQLDEHREVDTGDDFHLFGIQKRQREIGTLMAFGMPPNRVVRLFTLEGSLAALTAVVVALILGTIIFAWFQSVGLDVSHLAESQIPIRENIFLKIKPIEVILSVVVIVVIMILVAWAPVRKISRVNPTQALRGRAIT